MPADVSDARLLIVVTMVPVAAKEAEGPGHRLEHIGPHRAGSFMHIDLGSHGGIDVVDDLPIGGARAVISQTGRDGGQEVAADQSAVHAMTVVGDNRPVGWVQSSKVRENLASIIGLGTKVYLGQFLEFGKPHYHPKNGAEPANSPSDF